MNPPGPGDPIVLREFHDGRPWEARPAVVVDALEDSFRFFVPFGTRAVRAIGADGGRLRLPTGEWGHGRSAPSSKAVLSVASTVRPHAVLAIWDEGWMPRCWYVNLQAPLRRTAIGFDTTDLFLDLVGTPDATTWTWKDEDEATQAVAAGLLDDGTLGRIRDEAEGIASAIRRREPPFDGDWWAWRPDPAWAVPDLPADWDRG